MVMIKLARTAGALYACVCFYRISKYFCFRPEQLCGPSSCSPHRNHTTRGCLQAYLGCSESRHLMEQQGLQKSSVMGSIRVLLLFYFLFFFQTEHLPKRALSGQYAHTTCYLVPKISTDGLWNLQGIASKASHRTQASGGWRCSGVSHAKGSWGGTRSTFCCACGSTCSWQGSWGG